MKRTSLLIGVAILAACRSGSNAAPPVVSQPAVEPKSTPPHVGLTPPVIHVVLDDPRLVHARELERAKDYAGALAAVRDARPPEMAAEDHRVERCGWDFAEARLASAANQPLEAAAAFSRVEDGGCVLAGWAKLRGAQSLARAGHADEALARARTIPEDIAAGDEPKILVAEALAAKGDRAGALPLWRAWLAQNPHGSRWVDTSVRIASALLDGIDGPPNLHAREALDVATRVVVEAPKLAEPSGATAVRARAVAVVRMKEPKLTDALSDLDKAKQAQAWLELGEPSKAFELSSMVFTAAKTGPAACHAAVTRANAAGKARGVKVDGWSDAVAACEKDDQLVSALYSGAKARAGKDPKLAIDWFARVEQRFPAHRLADDSRYRGALLVAQSSEDKHEERAEQMLRTLPDAYPEGDMRAEALFHVALARIQRGAPDDWEAAKPLLDRIVEMTPDDHHWATAGRAAYFRARAAAATGDAADAKRRWAHIVEADPLSFYMLLAYARVARDDAALAERTLTDAVARDELGTFPATAHAEVDSPAFVRAMRLLEVGELDAAKREFGAAGALADGVDPEVVWEVGALYNEAGAPEIGHAFSRARLTDFLGHYPAGRWRTPWEVAFPRAFDALVTKACSDNALPTSVAWGIMREESSFVAEAKSGSNAFGLMQLVGSTARWIAVGTPYATDEAALKRPDVSIGLGTRLLAKLRTTHGHPVLAIGAYNAGSGSIDRWLTARGDQDLDVFVELVPYDETRNYIKRVLASQAAYAYLYEPSALKETLELPLRLAR